MKNIVLCISFCLFSLCGYSQTARVILQQFLEKMTTGPVEMAFKFTYNNVPKKINNSQTGILIYNGQQFHLQLGDLDVYCDGVSKWVYNESVGEVTVFPAEEEVEMTDNPLTYIMNNGDDFRYRPAKRLVQHGKKVQGIDLVPQSKDAVYTMINLQVEEVTFLPVQITYRMKDGQRYIIDVDTVDTNITVKPFSFVFPAHLYPDAVINDLR
jgi:outer membrane lipoprotein-sorting protein